MSGLGAWIRAARPLAQANLAMPLLFGQALAYERTGLFSWPVLAAVALFGVLDQLVIVFWNDLADRDHDDPERRTLFSGGSGVLQSGRISVAALGRAAAVVTGLLVALVVALAVWRTPWMFALGAAALLLLYLYSYGPRLSYRGGGEWCQALGVGAVLPLVGFAAQAGELSSMPFEALLATVALGYAGNIATALPDVVADRRAKKRTLAVRVGVARAAWACVGVTMGAVYMALLTSGQFRGGSWGGWMCLCALPLLVIFRLRLQRRRDVLVFVVAQGLSAQALLVVWSLAASALG